MSDDLAALLAEVLKASEESVKEVRKLGTVGPALDRVTGRLDGVTSGIETLRSAGVAMNTAIHAAQQARESFVEGKTRFRRLKVLAIILAILVIFFAGVVSGPWLVPGSMLGAAMPVPEICETFGGNAQTHSDARAYCIFWE